MRYFERDGFAKWLVALRAFMQERGAPQKTL
jgi:hypothetical protein